VLGITAAAIVMLKFVDADCAAGCVESVIVTATVFVLAEPCAGVPVIAPVE
jgi:hypothetical protein